MEKYYQILGLPVGASKEQIKSAYRKLAMKYHPDVNPTASAKNKFLEIIEAYEYLTGIRKAKREKRMTATEMQNLYEIMKKVAEQRAKEKYKERVRQFKKEKEKKQAEESVEVLNKVGINSQEASALIVITQHYDTLQAISENTKSNLILLPNNPSSASDMLTQMTSSFAAVNQINLDKQEEEKE